MESLYAHLRDHVEKESPAQLIDRMRKLFIEGRGYCDPHIELALYRIVLSETQQTEFKYILNRCCHILINYWHVHPQRKSACRDLVALFQEMPVTTTSSFIVCRLQQLIQQFIASEEYQNLEHLVETIENRSGINAALHDQGENTYFKQVINRYPFFYDCHFVSQNSSDEECLNIRQLQSQKQQDFEVNLYQYLQENRGTQASRGTGKASVNPTQLSHQELQEIVVKFGRKEGVLTYQNETVQLVLEAQGKSYQKLKQVLGEYLLSEIDDHHCQTFNQQMRQFLQGLFVEQNSTSWQESLLVETCQSLLDYLIPTPQHKDALKFYILINHNQIQSLGAVSLLLKILLLAGWVSGNLKPLQAYLIERIYLWLGHFKNLNNHQWLIKFLDYLQVVFTLTFRNRDTVLNQWIENH